METVIETGSDQVAVPVTAGHTTLLELHGDIDLEVAEPLRDSVLAGVERNDDIFVDLTDVTMIDCASLGVLVQARHLADRRGRTVILVTPSPAIERTLAATGLDNAFPVIRDRRESPSATASGIPPAHQRVAVGSSVPYWVGFLARHGRCHR